MGSELVGVERTWVHQRPLGHVICLHAINCLRSLPRQLPQELQCDSLSLQIKFGPKCVCNIQPALPILEGARMGALIMVGVAWLFPPSAVQIYLLKAASIRETNYSSEYNKGGFTYFLPIFAPTCNPVCISWGDDDSAPSTNFVPRRERRVMSVRPADEWNGPSLGNTNKAETGLGKSSSFHELSYF